MLTKAPRGTRDVLPKDINKWVFLEERFKKICGDFGYEEIRTPIFEHTELFQRGVGETTDIVEKEMYTFTDKGGRSLTLKPEGTAAVVRAYLEHKLYTLPQPIKLFYEIPGFRYERPQAGRLREFHQFGIEVLGAADPQIDVEVIALAMMFFDRLGLKDIELHINSIGCPKCRQAYKETLLDIMNERANLLCDTCKNRLKRNPLRIFDCKNPECKKNIKNIPTMLESLCKDCKNHFEKLKSGLSLIGLNYIINPNIVRGLDYYTRTVFEIVSKELGAQDTICGGGRYDGLVEECGGGPTPGIGFAMGIERLIMTLDAQGFDFPTARPIDVFIITLDDEKADLEGLKLLYKLRNEEISADKDYLGRSLRSQMKYADKYNARYTIIIGEEEIEKGKYTIKEMNTGDQKEMSFEELINLLKLKR